MKITKEMEFNWNLIKKYINNFFNQKSNFIFTKLSVKEWIFVNFVILLEDYEIDRILTLCQAKEYIKSDFIGFRKFYQIIFPIPQNLTLKDLNNKKFPVDIFEFLNSKK